MYSFTLRLLFEVFQLWDNAPYSVVSCGQHIAFTAHVYHRVHWYKLRRQNIDFETIPIFHVASGNECSLSLASPVGNDLFCRPLSAKFSALFAALIRTTIVSQLPCVVVDALCTSNILAATPIHVSASKILLCRDDDAEDRQHNWLEVAAILKCSKSLLSEPLLRRIAARFQSNSLSSMNQLSSSRREFECTGRWCSCLLTQLLTRWAAWHKCSVCGGSPVSALCGQLQWWRLWNEPFGSGALWRM